MLMRSKSINIYFKNNHSIFLKILLKKLNLMVPIMTRIDKSITILLSIHRISRINSRYYLNIYKFHELFFI